MAIAGELRPGFGQDDTEGVAAIVAAVGALPLAIEIVAARAQWMTARQLAASLTEEAGDDPMDQALDWSWTQLSEAERGVLGALSVFAA